MSDNKVKLLCSDGETVVVDLDIAEKSILIKGMIDDAGPDEEIPLPNVKKAILDKVIEYCMHLRNNSPPDIEKPLRSSNISDVTSEWYANFINLDQDMLFEMILAANYLDVKSLLELSCAKIASLIKNKSVQEIRKFFMIENDFTPEEESQIMEENKWAEESF